MSPASYLTAPPRVAGDIIARCYSRRMLWAVWIALGVSVLALLLGAGRAATQALRCFRALRGHRRAPRRDPRAPRRDERRPRRRERRGVPGRDRVELRFFDAPALGGRGGGADLSRRRSRTLARRRPRWRLDRADRPRDQDEPRH